MSKVGPYVCCGDKVWSRARLQGRKGESTARLTPRLFRRDSELAYSEKRAPPEEGLCLQVGRKRTLLPHPVGTLSILGARRHIFSRAGHMELMSMTRPGAFPVRAPADDTAIGEHRGCQHDLTGAGRRLLVDMGGP